MTMRCAICGVPLQLRAVPTNEEVWCRRCAGGVPVAAPKQPARRVPGIFWISLAAAVLLIVLTAGLTYWITSSSRKPGVPGPVAVAPAPGPVALAAPRSVPKTEVDVSRPVVAAPLVVATVPAAPVKPQETPALLPPVVRSDPLASVTAPTGSSPPVESSTTPKDTPPLVFPRPAPPAIVVPGPSAPPAKIVPPVVPPPPEKAAPTDTIAFFTSKARGKRFCIIADCSGSMSGAPILYLKKEMVQTLASLQDDSQFYIIFFSSQAYPMQSPTWVNGGKANVSRVVPWIQAVPAFGGTQPTTAFVKAFQLRPRPDVIFFMTDGIIPVTVPDQVAALNRAEPRIVVNTIMFAHPNILGTGRPAPLAVLQPSLTLAANLLSRIAKDSGGTYDMVKLGLP
jgi:von Willebrand factor type A domain